MVTKRQTWQIVNQKPLEVLESGTREQLDVLNVILDSKMDFPFRVSLDPNINILNIKGSEVTPKKSNGAGGVESSFTIASSLSGNIVVADSSLNFDDGSTTGSFAQGVQASCPSVAAGFYIWMGIELKTDGKLYTVWGEPSFDDIPNPDLIFTAEPLVSIKLQRTASGGLVPWNFLKPVTSSFKVFKGAKPPKISEDGVNKIRVIDLVSTSLPLGAVTIDGVTIQPENFVLFTKYPIEGIYKAVGSVGNISSWTKLFTPSNGANVKVTEGTYAFQTIWKRISTDATTNSGLWAPLELSKASKASSGFLAIDDSTISFNDALRTFTLSPKAPKTSFDIACDGAVSRINTSLTTNIPDTVGYHFIYFVYDAYQSMGPVLTSTTDPSFYQDYYNSSTSNLIVAQIYWDGDKASIVGDERHGIVMDYDTRKFTQLTKGIEVLQGLSLNYAYPSFDGDGSSNDEAQYTISDGRLLDEDIDFKIIDVDSAPSGHLHKQVLSSAPAQIPMFYKLGAGTWLSNTATPFPVLHVSGETRLSWNKFDGSNWVLETAADDSYVSIWVFATNSVVEPIIGVVGQNNFTTLPEAITESSISFGDFPAKEYKAIYRIIYHTQSTYTNDVYATVVNIQDLRITNDSAIKDFSPQDHSLLSGLNDPDHGPTAVTTVGVTKDGGLSDSDHDLKNVLQTLNSLFGQMRLKATNSNTVKVTGSDRLLNNGTLLGQAVGQLLATFDGAYINFATGKVWADEAQTVDLGLDFEIQTIPTGEYHWYSVTAVAKEVTAANTISLQLLVLPNGSSEAVKEDAPLAPFAPGMKLGQVIVKSTGAGAGNIETIVQSDIVQLGVGSGGGGEGTGNEDEISSRIKLRLNSSGYLYAEPNVFSVNGSNSTNTIFTTANYSVVSSSYIFENGDETYQSLENLDPYFIAHPESDIDRVELLLYYHINNVDENSTVELSRNNGATWHEMMVERIADSDTVRGTLLLGPDASNDVPLNPAFGPNAGSTQVTNTNSPTRMFHIDNTFTLTSIVSTISLTGTPTGTITAKIVKDVAGTPSTDPMDVIAVSMSKSINTLVAGADNLNLPITATLPSGSYHVIFETDASYKLDFTNSVGANFIAFQNDGVGILYKLKGRALGLLLRITAGTAGASFRGYGLLYAVDESNIYYGTDSEEPYPVSFDGIAENLSSFTLPFTPGTKLKVYEIKSGQIYRFGAFTLSGNTVVFPSNTFSKPGIIQLLFEQ